MDPWLRRFGSYGQLPGNDPTKIGYFIKTADKSLVVSILSAGTLCVWKHSIAPKPITERSISFLLALALYLLPRCRSMSDESGESSLRQPSSRWASVCRTPSTGDPSLQDVSSQAWA